MGTMGMVIPSQLGVLSLDAVVVNSSTVHSFLGRVLLYRRAILQLLYIDVHCLWARTSGTGTVWRLIKKRIKKGYFHSQSHPLQPMHQLAHHCHNNVAIASLHYFLKSTAGIGWRRVIGGRRYTVHVYISRSICAR